uniref:SKA complex subunit 1 n=1 Tax=Caligus clemensi TaxID=344056 RepID=C1C250_CALCM|nr:Spindle and kinetochore-associated protein 1 [Caligus clemensi]
MDRLTTHFKDRLCGIESSLEWITTGNLQETLSVVDSTAFTYASIEKKLLSIDSLEGSHEKLLMEATRLQTAFATLNRLQGDVFGMLPDAMLKSQDRLQQQAVKQQPSGASKAASSNSCPPPCAPALKKPKDHIPSLTLLKIPEFDSVPTYMKGRLTYSGLNSAMEEFNGALKTKYVFLQKGFKPTATLKMRNKYQDLKKLETKETKGVFFLVLDDIKGINSFKTDSARKSIFSILRHFKKIREIRGPGPLIRYAIVEANNA